MLSEEDREILNLYKSVLLPFDARFILSDQEDVFSLCCPFNIQGQRLQEKIIDPMFLRQTHTLYPGGPLDFSCPSFAVSDLAIKLQQEIFRGAKKGRKNSLVFHLEYPISALGYEGMTFLKTLGAAYIVRSHFSNLYYVTCSTYYLLHIAGAGNETRTYILLD